MGLLPPLLPAVLAFSVFSHPKKSVLANKFSSSCPSVLFLNSVPRSDPFRKSVPKSLFFNMRKNSLGLF